MIPRCFRIHMAIAHPLDIEYLIFRMKPKHHDVLCSGRAYHFLENLDRGHLISIRHGLGKPFQYFRIPFDVASRDKDAFSRHTPQQTFVRQRVNGVANRLPGRSILIRQLIFEGQRRTFFSYQAPKYFSVSVALAAPFRMASSMVIPSTMPYRKPAI